MISYLIPGTFPSVANLREHWATKARRVKAQRAGAGVLTACSVGLTESADLQAFGGTVTLTRLAPRRLDDDNLAGSLKACRDGIAQALGVDDGDERIAWRYAQEPCKRGQEAVLVAVECARPE